MAAKYGVDSLPTPKEIKEQLDSNVIDQEEAKKVLAVSVYNHFKRIFYNKQKEFASPDKVLLPGLEIQKSNILLIGPTGSGKTLLAQTLAESVNVPLGISDATTLTEAGYVGDDVENVLLRLIQKTDYDLEVSSMGIIYIDEIDKIARKSESMSITRDVSGEGVQQALLKLIEGNLVSVPAGGGRKHPHQDMLQIDTSNILFICGGAFEGLEKIINKRVAQTSMGFSAEVREQEEVMASMLPHLQPDDLVKYGMIPEFVGRLPVISILNSLSEDALVQILTEPRNAIIKQYQFIFMMDNVELDFTEDALVCIAKKAIQTKTGARGLRSILEKTLMDLMYDLPDLAKKYSRITITKEAVEHGDEYVEFMNKPRKLKKTVVGKRQ